MELFSDLTTRVAALRGLTGEISDPARLPAAVERLGDAEVLALLETASAAGRLVERLRFAAVGVVAQRSHRAAGHAGLAQSRGHRSTISLVQQITGASRSEAAKQVRVGESLYDGAESTESAADIASEITGSAAPPAESGLGPQNAHDVNAVLSGGMPWQTPLSRALMHGAVSTAQHDAILRGLGQPPDPECDRIRLECAAAWTVAAEQLVEQAAVCPAEELTKTARFIRDQLDPVGAEARFQTRYEARSFRMWTDREGRACASIIFDDYSAAWVRSILDAALRPRRGGPRFVDPAEQARADELIADPRTNEQLAFDLLIDVLRTGSHADAASVYGARQPGVRLVQVIGTPGCRRADFGLPQDGPATGDSDHATNEHERGIAYTEDGLHALPAWVARQQACTTGVTPITVDHTGNPLRLGRTTRLFTAAQRLALAARDGGCRWIGCDRPASYCEAHHIDPWHSAQGRTDIDRGVLLCRFHHMQLHHGGWRITRNGLDDFALHDPGGDSTPLPPRLELRYAWAGINPPLPRFRPREDREGSEDKAQSCRRTAAALRAAAPRAA